MKMDSSKAFGTCRCCLSTSNQTFHMSEVIFDQFHDENGTIVSANYTYFDFTGLAEDSVPDFSLKICMACKELLETSYAFRKTCLESHRNWSNVCIKKGN
jgi:Zinc-finger associated domain (zf-AD)